MSASDTNTPHRGSSALGRTARKRSVRIMAAATVTTLTAGAIVLAGGGSAAAAGKPLSQSGGRFLSGSIAGTNLDTLAGIEGENATNPGNPGANANSLNVELLNDAIKLPFKQGLQLPPLGGIQLGAVSQYAKANADGSAIGASGAVDSNGGIGVGGSDGVPKGGATLDLAGLPGAKALTDALGDLKLTIGAVSARAKQVSFGKAAADASASCVNKPYSRVSDKSQTGEYNVAGLTLDLTSNALAGLATQLYSTLGGVLTTLQSTLNTTLNGVVTITGLPDAKALAKALTATAANGSISLSLDGGVHLDLAGLLNFLGLPLNKLCPNTSLLPLVVDAITTELPKALVDLLTQLGSGLTDALGKIKLTVAGADVALSTVTSALTAGKNQLTTALTAAGKELDTSALSPLIDALTNTLLNIVVNGQQESGGTLTETAVQLNILSSGGAVGFANLAAGDPVVQLNLAQAAVGPSTAAAPPTTAAPAPPSTTVPSTSIPVGVPAGQAGHGGSPVLPLVLLLLGLTLAGGGVLTFRMRGKLGH